MTYARALREISRLLIGLVLCGALAGCGDQDRALEQSHPETRPNILFAIADDWGWPHAGAYGAPVVSTPTFDHLADQGVLFSHAYVSSPSCTPSRAAILTGQWHWRLQESGNLWSTLRSEYQVYPDLLEQSGYYVGYTRKGWGPGKIEPGGRTRNPAGPHFESFEEFLEKRPREQPFCFWFGSQDPHRPYEPGLGAGRGMRLDQIELPSAFPDSPEVRSDVADYFWEVERFDREVGELLSLLEDVGESSNTLVVMTGDHGMPFPRCKGNLYDSGARVPLAMLWPSMISPGHRMDSFVSLTDLAPTFLEAAGVTIPAAMTGRSLLETLRLGRTGRSETSREYIITGKERHVPGQENPDSGGTPMRAIRTKDYLYIRNFRPDRWPAGTPNWDKAFFPGSWYGDVDNGPTKSYMIENRDKDDSHRLLFELAFAKRPQEELYDLRVDPGQLQNVAGDSTYSQIRNDLSDRLMEELSSTDDPRLHQQEPLFDVYPYYGGSPLKPGFKVQQDD